LRCRFSSFAALRCAICCWYCDERSCCSCNGRGGVLHGVAHRAWQGKWGVPGHSVASTASAENQCPTFDHI
jgi:hypothetical protein